MTKCTCGNKKVRLIYSCSGGADVGALADKVARKLAKTETGNMSCIASVGAEIPGFISSARNADCNITIDGCNIRCAAKNLENRGVKPLSFVISNFGFEKGQTDPSPESLEKVAEKLTEKIRKEHTQTKPNKSHSCGCGCSC